MSKYLIDIRQNNKKGYGFIVKINKPYQVFIQKKFRLQKCFFYIFRIHRCKIAFEFGPCRIINFNQVIHVLISILKSQMFICISGFLLNPVGYTCKSFRKNSYSTNIFMIAVLLIIIFKSVFFKKLLIVGFMVRHSITGVGKPFHQKTPMIIIFSKINWSIHSFHPFSFKPIYCCIK